MIRQSITRTTTPAGQALDNIEVKRLGTVVIAANVVGGPHENGRRNHSYDHGIDESRLNKMASRNAWRLGRSHIQMIGFRGRRSKISVVIHVTVVVTLVGHPRCDS